MTKLIRIQEIKIKEDLKSKIVFLVGPRQVGKTWLAKKIALAYKMPLYLNYDAQSSREIIHNQSWNQDTDLLIFDEIHKMKGWKNYIKGIFDTKQDTLHILVTGSARLDTYKNTGDSLAGRYRVHHLLPLSFNEIAINNSTIITDDISAYQVINHLIERSGFPEPYLAQSVDDAQIWRKLYSESLLREDILEFSAIESIQNMRYVFELLQTKAGSPVSYASIARDVGISPVTVKRYIHTLEALYIIFLVKPHAKIRRAIKKEPKVYFYDTGLVKGDDGVKVENMVAVHLLKHILAVRDQTGTDIHLNFLKNKQANEVDFAIVKDGEIAEMIEVKQGQHGVADGIDYFTRQYNCPAYQIVKNMNSPQFTYKNRVYVTKISDYVKKLIV